MPVSDVCASARLMSLDNSEFGLANALQTERHSGKMYGSLKVSAQGDSSVYNYKEY